MRKTDLKLNAALLPALPAGLQPLPANGAGAATVTLPAQSFAVWRVTAP